MCTLMREQGVGVCRLRIAADVFFFSIRTFKYYVLKNSEFSRSAVR